MFSEPLARDRVFLDEALALAVRGRGLAAPNPMVGCVIEREGRIIGRGHHEYAAKDHAEVVALRAAGEDARGATLHVSLEPCSSTGRTGPCTEAIRLHGISRVTCCTVDPDSRHRGRGLAELEEAGLEVAVGYRREDAVRLNAVFFGSEWKRRPHVTLKLASSLDGGIATATGESRWITGDAARRAVHELRATVDAVLVGAGTVRTDDPRLTVRLPHPSARTPGRCVIDPRLRSDPAARIFREPGADEEGGDVTIFTAETVLVGEGARRADALRSLGAAVVGLPRDAEEPRWLDLGALLDELRRREARSLLVEGGAVTAGRFLADPRGLVDLLWWHVAPVLLGDQSKRAIGELTVARLADAPRMRFVGTESLGPDVAFRAEVLTGFDPKAVAEELARCESEATCSRD